MRFSGPLKENRAFRRIYRRGTSVVSASLVLYARRNGTPRSRVGITVSGKLGCAVARNLVRRRLREIYRTNEVRFQPGWDLVVVARTRAMNAPYAQLEREYLALAGRLGLLTKEGAAP